MISITEAILNRKQTTSDILSSQEEQLRLFNQAFRKVLGENRYTNTGITSSFKGRKQEQLVITMDPNTLANVKNQDHFNVNFYELDTGSWPFPKDIVFENLKQPITIVLKGSNIDGFNFSSKKCKGIVFYVYEDQVMSNCSFNCGLMDSVVVILKKGTDYLKQRLGLIYDYLLSPYELVDARFNPLSTDKWNIISRCIGNNNDFHTSTFHTKIKIDTTVNRVDRTHDPDVQERQNNRNAIIEKIRKIYGFYGINLNQETL